MNLNVYFLVYQIEIFSLRHHTKKTKMKRGCLCKCEDERKRKKKEKKRKSRKRT